MITHKNYKQNKDTKMCVKKLKSSFNMLNFVSDVQTRI